MLSFLMMNENLMKQKQTEGVGIERLQEWEEQAETGELAIKRDLNKKKDIADLIVKKTNTLVRSKVTVGGVNASRILAVLISQIRTDDTEKDLLNTVYQISAKNYIHIPEAGSGKKYTLIEQACAELSRAVFEEIYNIERGYYSHRRPFFMDVIYNKGMIYARFNPSMTEHLLDLKKFFTEYSLVEYLRLPTQYSQRLYEILSSWKNTGECIMTLKELNILLATPPSVQNAYKNFNLRVLTPASEAINKLTNLHFTWEPIKDGRAVTSIRFIFHNEPAMKALPALKKEKTPEPVRQQLKKVVSETTADALTSPPPWVETSSSKKVNVNNISGFFTRINNVAKSAEIEGED